MNGLEPNTELQKFGLSGESPPTFLPSFTLVFGASLTWPLESLGYKLQPERSNIRIASAASLPSSSTPPQVTLAPS
jgi:hypothetical protein